MGEIPRIVSLAWRATTAGGTLSLSSLFSQPLFSASGNSSFWAARLIDMISTAPGPVLVDFPIDILFTPVQNEDIAWGSVTSPAVHRPGSNPAAIDDVINIWQQAKRPVILVSTGAASAAKEVVALAEETNTPIFHSFKYSTKIPTSHPLWGGPANTLALLRNQSEQQPDFVLILGARTGFITGGRSGAIVPREADAKVVQVDLDGSEIGRSRRIDVGIVGDVALVAVELTAAMAKSHSFKAPDMWVQTAVKLKESRINSAENEEESVIIKENGRLHPYHGVKTLLQSLPHGSILCIDGGEAGQWALQNVSHARADLSMNVNGYLGFLGNGFGYALGAAVAEPEKLVVNWHGDGSAGFHIGELDTYAKFGLKILTVVVNNSVWGMSEAGQELIYGEKTPQRPCVAMNPAVRYEVVAQGFGCESVVVDPQELGDNSGEQTLRVLREAVEKLTQSQRPALLNLKVSNVPYQSTTKAMVSKCNAGLGNMLKNDASTGWAKRRSQYNRRSLLRQPSETVLQGVQNLGKRKRRSGWAAASTRKKSSGKPWDNSLKKIKMKMKIMCRLYFSCRSADMQ